MDGMMGTMRTRIFHRALGATALAVGVAYGVEILRQWSEIRPFTGLGWHREHLATAGGPAAAGAFNLLTGRGGSPLGRIDSAPFLHEVAVWCSSYDFYYTE